MIKVTIRNMPTNFTSNQTRTFSDLETAMRKVREMDTILVAIEEEGVGFHKVPLTKDGATALSPLSYGTPTGGSTHYSEKYKEIDAKINAENSKPKLA
jgi:hypothetical protein